MLQLGRMGTARVRDVQVLWVGRCVSKKGGQAGMCRAWLAKLMCAVGAGRVGVCGVRLVELACAERGYSSCRVQFFNALASLVPLP